MQPLQIATRHHQQKLDINTPVNYTGVHEKAT